MSTLLKDIFSPELLSEFSRHISIVTPGFPKEEFIQNILTKEWDHLELKERMRHISTTLHLYLPNDFTEAAKIICDLIDYYQANGLKEDVINHCFLPDYIEQFGLDHYDASVSAIEKVTQFTSCEFAVRPFIIEFEDRMIEQMLKWSTHKNDMVRRLASEGIRPRLPWAMALPALKKNPEPILPILENLKNDPADFVRRSVANNLNDISKDNPVFTISVLKKWHGISKETDAVIKHAGRTLLKKGNEEMLELFGCEYHNCIQACRI